LSQKVVTVEPKSVRVSAPGLGEVGGWADAGGQVGMGGAWAGMELVKLLLAKGADVNAAARLGGVERTPLRFAAAAMRDCRAGGAELAELLLSAGVWPDG